MKRLHSYVDVRVRVRVEHEPDVDPSDLICDCNYQFAYDGDSGRINGTEITDAEVVGQFDPATGALHTQRGHDAIDQ